MSDMTPVEKLKILLKALDHILPSEHPKLDDYFTTIVAELDLNDLDALKDSPLMSNPRVKGFISHSIT